MMICLAFTTYPHVLCTRWLMHHHNLLFCKIVFSDTSISLKIVPLTCHGAHTVVHIFKNLVPNFIQMTFEKCYTTDSTSQNKVPHKLKFSIKQKKFVSKDMSSWNSKTKNLAVVDPLFRLWIKIKDFRTCLSQQTLRGKSLSKT